MVCNKRPKYRFWRTFDRFTLRQIFIYENVHINSIKFGTKSKIRYALWCGVLSTLRSTWKKRVKRNCNYKKLKYTKRTVACLTRKEKMNETFGALRPFTPVKTFLKHQESKTTTIMMIALVMMMMMKHGIKLCQWLEAREGAARL